MWQYNINMQGSRNYVIYVQIKLEFQHISPSKDLYISQSLPGLTDFIQDCDISAGIGDSSCGDGGTCNNDGGMGQFAW